MFGHNQGDGCDAEKSENTGDKEPDNPLEIMEGNMFGGGGVYMEFIPPWKEANTNGEPVTDHFVSIGNVLVLDDEHMNEWLHQQDSSPGDSHAFSREKHSNVRQRQQQTSVNNPCKCSSRPNGLSDCCMTNTSGQSMLVDDSFPLPWVEHNSDDVPQKHVENWSYSCPSEANKSQLDHAPHLTLDDSPTNQDEYHIDLSVLHKHQNRQHHHRHHHHHQHSYCTQLGILEELEQCDLRERVHKWLMNVDRSKTDFENIDEIT